jgi:predicted AlkP superfamily phosphohydrolase/phosphomutase
MSSQCKMLLLGLDGATWQVLDPLLQAGKLPHIERLIARGTSGVLRSFEYSASPVAWTTIATGKMPARHNIKDFRVSRRDLRAKQIWEILAEQGHKVGIFQYLVTWPPRAVDGFIVPGWLAPDSAAHPSELQFVNEFVNKGRFVRRGETNSLRDYAQFGACAVRYGLRVPTLLSIVRYMLGRIIVRYEPLDARYRIRRIWMALSTDLFCYLLRRHQPHFAAIVFYQTDSIGHYFWKFSEPDLFRNVDPVDATRYGDVIDRIYCQADATIGRILNLVGDDCMVFVLSDHGMGPAIHESGLLYRPRVEGLLESLGVEWHGGRHAVIGLNFHIRVDRNQSGTWTSGYGRFRAFIEGIRVCETGEQVFETQLLSEGPASVRVKTARPELREAAVQLPNGEIRPYETLVNVEEELSGAHQPEGVVIMAGPGIKQGYKLREAHLADVTPTMLALLGVSVGRDMDGNVLLEAIEEPFLRAHPVAYIDSYEDDADHGGAKEQVSLKDEEREIVEERLRSLGYLN